MLNYVAPYRTAEKRPALVNTHRQQHPPLRQLALLGGLLVSWLLIGHPVSAVVIQFDYSHDKLGFFDDPARRELLDLAADTVVRFVDTLEPIEPRPGSGWSIFPPLPPSGANRFLDDQTIPSDTVMVIVGGNDVLPERTLAETSDAEPIWRSGPPEWKETIHFRGQIGAGQVPATDYGPWGGVIQFNADPDDIPWYFGRSPDLIEPRQFDFVTVAMHELMHVLGFGTAGSFQALTQSGSDTLQFTGPESLALTAGGTNNEQLQLYDSGHWGMDTFGLVGRQREKALMGPIVNPGKRRYPTSLDRAALRDIGWQEALPGDANLDRKFDMLDIVQVLQADEYKTGTQVGWSDGNWNDDGVFDQRDIIRALSAGVFLTGPYASRGLPAEGAAAPLLVPEPSSFLLLCTGLLAGLTVWVYACPRLRCETFSA